VSLKISAAAILIGKTVDDPSISTVEDLDDSLLVEQDNKLKFIINITIKKATKFFLYNYHNSLHIKNVSIYEFI